MARKTIKDFIAVLGNVYFKGIYDAAKHYIQEVALLHSTRISSVGGEQRLNDANTSVEVGVSDFNGTQIPSDFRGLIRGLAVRYGKVSKTGNPDPNAISPATVNFSALRSDFPAWLRNSEIVFKASGVEALRMRVDELLLAQNSDEVPSEWAKEFEKTIKVVGGQDLELYLNTAKGAALSDTDWEFIQLVIYGLKFADRKTM